MARLMVVAAIVLAVWATARGEPIRGATEKFVEDLQGGSIKCAALLKPTNVLDVTMDMVNDEYCDCADGSDEPGTSACVNGRFFCKSDGIRGRMITASWVNDGVCDCCDGSDEFDGRTNCTNHCAEDLQRQLQYYNERIEVIKKGLKIEYEMSEVGKYAFNSLSKTLAELRHERDTLKNKKTEAEQNHKIVSTAQEALTTTDEAADATGSSLPESDEVIEEQIDEACKQVHESLAEVSAHAIESTLQKVLSKLNLESVLDTALGEGTSAQWQRSFIERCRTKSKKILVEINSRLSDIDAEEKDLLDRWEAVKVVGDDAKDLAMRTLAKDCIDAKFGPYTYTYCAFWDIRQFQRGRQLANMGRWGRYEDGKQVYENGSQCYEGPKRSTRVTLICGDNSEILEVAEPEKCEFQMKIMTPAACTYEELHEMERLRDELQNIV
mmetsp:Transcript_4319/g.13047  ORF Transcript_4319/g.13047 Transcript_4319/m.13047 type:complete len:439 (+) Transcript_4319:81-1397(+)|eukprot:CAMPEP_0198737946 /NCGR_PEP_ID=MMETSP1475-20131203/68127_1 /TAXON_ID= ORGANISM="Unidentified sp., Strain CCMP1999" /NCGR_SAMPLE_ID=MMETSP1475 /ASSEMBLY_ACC=CAM_ASM_001111 /LENGTH=438 /DNA_ID=CAMNT_0044501817 /DNA_START=35 /DNA_END=1351 /DNA_ORIENTATION=-